MKGVGSTSFQLDSGVILHINDILFVSGLKKNLLSIFALEDKGHRVAFVDGQVLVWHKDLNMHSSRVIFVRERGLYILMGCQVEALVNDSISIYELCHRRFSHLHYRSIPALRQMVTGLLELQVEHDGVSKGCALGNNCKGSFLRSGNQSKGILDLVLPNVCGLMKTPSLVGYLYYVIFINELTQKIQIYILNSKDEVFIKFQKFRDLVENLTWRHIQALRTNNGGEFTSNDFNDLYKDARIKTKMIVP